MSGSSEWFDAHLDLAYLAENGRDLHASVEKCRGRYQPASVTVPSMIEGGVKWCLVVLFEFSVVWDDPWWAH